MSPKPITENTLFYGDNLPILREYVPSECVDLVYLDPPFNSNGSYNVLFREESGHDSESQLVAFDDTWHWGEAAEQTYRALATEAAPNVSKMIAALHDFIGTNQMMAYLVWYTGSNRAAYRIGYAVSTDNGRTWQKSPHNPVLDLGPAGSWDSTSLQGASVLREGDGYRMWYTERDPDNVYRLNYAWSAIPPGEPNVTPTPTATPDARPVYLPLLMTR